MPEYTVNREITFCSAKCSRFTCFRRMDDNEHARTKAFNGHPGAPRRDYSEDCWDFIPQPS